MSAADDLNIIRSYRNLRRIIGILGFALPVVCLVWGFVLSGWGTIQPTISDYYELRTRDFFVGSLFAIACFLGTYRGPEPIDHYAGNLACVFALIVALFRANGTGAEPYIHLFAAGLLLLTLAFFSYSLFTKTSGLITPQKLVRNKIYRGSAIIIVACVVVILFLKVVVSASSSFFNWHPVFWLEWAALWSFGVSWFVKGETLFRDDPPTPSPQL
ncbi:MAG TPA: hypothetical protein VE967_04790 [Gemmatimonadaceae bacterium]|nr:hypothetical protein [Gemmatimonadaceae bacterium]